MSATIRVRRSPRAAFAVAMLAALLHPAAARAADAFYDATVGLRVGDDARFFLNLTNEHYAVPEKTAVSVVNRCPRPQDDYPVVMLVARLSGRSPESILALRLHGAPWVDVFARAQVSPDVLFVGMDRDPGPPYGHAWGYWKKHGDFGDARTALSDEQIADLVKLQIVSGYYHVSPYNVISERQRGTTIERYAVVHGRPTGAAPAHQHPGHGERPDGGHGHGEGHDGDHGHAGGQDSDRN